MLPLMRISMLIVGIVGQNAIAAEDVSTNGDTVSVSVARSDMRSSDLAAVRKKAIEASSDGIVLVVYGSDAEALANVEGAALDAVAQRLPVNSILWAADSEGTGVAVYGIDGAPFGPRIPFGSELRSNTKNRIDELAVLQGRAGMVVASNGDTAQGAPDPEDVMRCRSVRETGSRVRRVRICSTPRQDRERALRAKDAGDAMRDRPYGGNDPKTGGG